MNKRIVPLFLILITFLLSSPRVTTDKNGRNLAFGQDLPRNSGASPIPNTKDIARNTISVGDKFFYKVKWGGITVASSELIVAETTNVQNQLTYHVVNRVWTEGVVAVFFKVENTVESFIDVNNLFSWRYVKNIKEGRYRDNLSVDFDQINHIAKRQDTTFAIPENVQDPLSILWYFRKLNIKKNDIINFSYCDGKKNGTIQIQVLKKETVSTPAGKFLTDVIEFSVGKKDRKYIKKQVLLKVWFSDDEIRMPVFIQAKAPVGIITGVLVNTNKINTKKSKKDAK